MTTATVPFHAAPGRPAALSPPARAVWIDRLRACLTGLVIVHHAAITYGASGSWFFKATDETNIGLTFLAAVNQAFFMGLFFLLSGALAVPSLDRKGPATFFADRALRLGLPALLFGFLLGPLTVSLATAPMEDILADAQARILEGRFVLGPLWFPAALLVFSTVFAALPRPVVSRLQVPPFKHWIALALATGLAALAIRQVVPVGATVAGFQLGYFASYVVLFALGIRAARQGWLDRLPRGGLVGAVAAGLVALPLLPAVLLASEAPRFETGLSAAAVAYALWEPLIALGAIAGLLLWSQARGGRAARVWGWAAANSYGAFVLHAPILVAVCRSLDAVGTSHGAALPLSIVATTLAAFGLTAVLRRSALVRQVI
ncbi:acyltransferase family protein [Roseicyclus persicicus]|uniref:Acyltransferase n=1 Tax=Roseicyclus persicicus TaxID=2650661 RepID=A0A7X6JZ04_9RHOB|nr:acyltransferase [Roseibacterium persicicum]NKX44650.1 acyltransferase [Roseibacterium persicicum]